MIIWYRCHVSKNWICAWAGRQPRRYSNSKDWLREAEQAMRGHNPYEVLSFKIEERAREMIWC